MVMYTIMMQAVEILIVLAYLS